jgi:hypothetical protein
MQRGVPNRLAEPIERSLRRAERSNYKWKRIHSLFKTLRLIA